MTPDPVAPEPARGAAAGRGAGPDDVEPGDRDRGVAEHGDDRAAEHEVGVDDALAEDRVDPEDDHDEPGATPEDEDGEPAADPGADDDALAGDRGDGGAAPAGAGRRLGRLAGIVAFAYVAWYVIGLVVLDTDPSRYNALNRATGNLAARLVLAGVLLALVYHLLDGLRVAVEDLVPGGARRDLQLRVGVRFLVPALWIPGALVLVWPAIRSWFSW